MDFRHVDDEILFGRLKAQLIQSLQGAPTHMLTNVLRVLGRIESVAFYEGVRQGVVARAIEDALGTGETLDARPIAQHGRVYAGGFTPLTAIEGKYIRRLMNSDAPDALAETALDHSLAAEPLEMPPMTLAEALADPRSSLSQMAAQEHPDPALLTSIFTAEEAAAREVLPASVAGFPPADGDDFADVLASCGDGSLASGFPSMETPNALRPKNNEPITRDFSLLRTDGSKHTTEHPAFIERCRDVLQGRMTSGWGPTNWSDIVFAIRDEIKADPYSIDVQLSTDVGKAMLRSLGLFEIADAVLDAESIDAMLAPRAGATL